MTDTQQQASAIVKMPGDQRKAQIIRAATDLFARAGYAGTSLRDVAEMCGMTKAALYYHYADKESLLRSVVEHRMTRLNEMMHAALNEVPEDQHINRIRAFVRACARQIDNDRSGWVVGARIFWSIESIGDRDEMIALRDAFEAMLRSEIEMAMSTGQMVQGDPAMVTRMILSWVNYIPRWHKTDGEMTSEQVVEEFLTMTLNGLATT
jgi:AcrR family transcriptional regulator